MKTKDGEFIVYWWDSHGNKVIKQRAKRVYGDRVEFADGGWNPVSSCYLTARQCRVAKNQPKSTTRRTMIRQLIQMDIQLERLRENIISVRDDFMNPGSEDDA